MAGTNVKQIHPTEVTYRNHNITLTHRPKINDWHYSFQHIQTLTIKSFAPRYDTALKQAKRDIDIMLGDKA
jgi:hypothetical protein